MAVYDYRTAVSRNIGWVEAYEQEALRTKRIAIAGLGGVGGSHFLTLTRLGVGSFHVADLDHFELANFNRQAGAFVSRIGQDKVEVLTELALDINPGLGVRKFVTGVKEENIDDFLSGVDLYVDALDFFAVSARRRVFAACAERGIPAVTAAPLGMGAALLNFLPGGMTFEEYFCLEGQTEEEQLLRFLLGLSPSMLQSRYLVDPSAVDIAGHRGPSTPMACELCAGMAATQALRILLRRGKVVSAPWGLHFDAYRDKLVRTWRPWGNRNPLQRLGLAIARRRFGGEYSKQNPPPEAPPKTRLEKVLDLARWAPSGDNCQQWRFEVLDDYNLVVHGFDTRDHCVYDLQGHASQIAHGALLETISIAAGANGLRADIRRRPDAPDTTPTFDVSFEDDAELQPEPLAPYIPVRTVQRRPMRMRPLGREEKGVLELSVGEGFRVRWLESLADRWRATRLIFNNAGLRLTLPEAYPVHRDVIQWNARFSEDKIPDRAVGTDPATTCLMHWALQSWGRVSFMNRYLGGTLLPRLELELVPGMACAAHFVILAENPPESIDDFVAAGRAAQRFWLTATRYGLNLQPEITPLIFHEYCRNGVRFSTMESMEKRAQEVSGQLQAMIGMEEADLAVFMGRIGHGSRAAARSLRLPIERLLLTARP